MLNDEEICRNAMTQFLEYASGYDRTNGKINLKIVHTQQVARVMQELAESMELSEHFASLAFLCAVYHDIGRFEQIVRYGTFNDVISTDHAKLSCEVLQQGDFLNSLCVADQKRVLTAIENHNKFSIGEEVIDKDTLQLCKMIRDADKLDIFRVFAYEDMVDTMGETIEQVSRETITDYVMDTFLKHQCVDKNKRVTGLDKWISFLGFVYDINFRASFQIMKRNQYYKIPFLKAKFQDMETQIRVDRILDELDHYIADKLQENEICEC